METIYLSREDLAELPDYTVYHPKDLPVGTRWKIFSLGDVFVGEKLSEEKNILKLAICSNITNKVLFESIDETQTNHHSTRRL